MKKILSIVLSVALLCVACALCVSAEDTPNSLKFDGTADYQAWYMWSHCKSTSDTFTLEFDVKGTAGTGLCVDNENGDNFVDYHIVATDTWEHVKVEANCKVNKDDATGAPLRIYTNWAHDAFVIANLVYTDPEGTAHPTSLSDAGCFDFGSWAAGSGVTCVYTELPSPATADMTAVVALIGVVACAGVAVVAKKH